MIEIIPYIYLDGAKKLTIPEGRVKKIHANGTLIWEETISSFKDLYQRVSYIATEGNSSDGWLETDFIGNNKSGIELIASFPTTGDVVTLGTREDKNTNSRFYGGWLYSTSRFCFGWNTTQTITKSNLLKTNTIYRARTNFLNDRYARLYTETETVGTIALSGTLVQQTIPATIFRYTRPDGGKGSLRRMKLYSVKFSQDSEIVREYIPCYRKSDGVAGLWETHTEQFLTSIGGEGTGFTIGEEIDWDVELFTEPINTFISNPDSSFNNEDSLEYVGE